MATYLDYNATAPVRPQAIEKMMEIMASPANPSSTHAYGRIAKKHLEDARKIIAESINAFTDEVIFTGSGTESNATALLGFPERRLLVSAIEHSSVLKCRADALLIPVDSNGIVDLSKLDKLLSADAKPALVSIMLANNETGVIQPLPEIAALCKKYNALLHCDAIQAFGKIPLEFGVLGVDMLSLASHKCGGPVGAAALMVRRNLPFQQLLKGGGQELSRRAGTENVAAIAGFGEALKHLDLAHMKNLRAWLDEFETGKTIFSKNVARLPNTSCVMMPGVNNETQLIDFDLKGFAVSAGSACSSGRIEVSHVLTAMGVPEKDAKCAIRVSGGWGTQKEEIVAFSAAWKSTCERLAKSTINA